MPEVNRNNNSWHTKGLCHKYEPLKFEFLGGDNEPEYTNAWYTPIIGTNVYDKFMVGILIHNQTIPKNKFEYTLAPMFSIGRKKSCRVCQHFYSWVPAKNFRMISIGLISKTFGNGLGVAADSITPARGVYYSFQPYLDLKIGKPVARSFTKHRLRLSGNYVIENGNLLYDNTIVGGSAVYTFSF